MLYHDRSGMGNRIIGNTCGEFRIDKEVPIPPNVLRVDEDLVRQLIQHRLREHRLPPGRAVGIPETHGDGQPCDACGEPIGPNQQAVLVMVSLQWMSVFFHTDCYEVWDAERLALSEKNGADRPSQ